MRLCPQGHPVDVADARFCPTCGAAVATRAPEQPACAWHPERPGAPCPRCGTFACDECLGPATAAVRLCPTCRAREAAQPLPWDRREEIGMWRAFFRTAWSFMFSPGPTIDQARPEGTLGSAVLFATLAQFLSILTTALLYGLAITGVGAIIWATGAPKPDSPTPALMAGIGIGATLGIVLFGVLLGVGSIFVVSALDQLVLRIIGANPKGWEVTFRASALATAPALCGLIPFCGLYVVPIWSMVLKLFLYRRFHGISTGKAALAALLVPITLMVVFGVAYVLLIFWANQQGVRT